MSSPVLLSIFHGFGVGGAQVRYASVANHFGAAFRHVIVAMNGDTSCRERLRSDLDITFLKVNDRTGGILEDRGSFRQLLRDVKPDILLTHNWGTLDWAMANCPRMVRHVHIEDGFGPEEQNGQLARRVYMRRLLLRRSTVVVPSKTLETIARDIWRLPKRVICYIPNGIDYERFAEDTPPLIPRDGVLTLGTVAALRPEKNLPRLLEAFGQLRQKCRCRLVIAGDGPEYSKTRAWVEQNRLTDSVVLTGYRGDTERVYASLDLFVLSSDTEQMPTSVLEAMAAGLPVVSTDVGDVKQMLPPENQPFVISRDSGAIASACAHLLADAALRRQLGDINRRRVRERYSQLAMFAAYEEIFGVRPKGKGLADPTSSSFA